VGWGRSLGRSLVDEAMVFLVVNMVVDIQVNWGKLKFRKGILRDNRMSRCSHEV